MIKGKVLEEFISYLTSIIQKSSLVEWIMLLFKNLKLNAKIYVY